MLNIFTIKKGYLETGEGPELRSSAAPMLHGSQQPITSGPGTPMTSCTFVCAYPQKTHIDA